MRINLMRMLGVKVGKKGLFPLRREGVLSLPTGRGIGGLTGVNAFRVTSKKGKDTLSKKTGIEQGGLR